MIHLQRVAENETIPGIKCDSCGAIVTFDTTLRDDQLSLSADDHEEMRATVEAAVWLATPDQRDPDRTE